MPPLARAILFLKAHGLRIALEGGVNFILPYLLYVALRPRLGEVGALIASSAPPLLWSLFEFIRRRTLDAVSLLALAGIALSLLAFAGGGGVKALQLREKLVTGVIALVFLGSAAIRKPLIYELARAGLRRRSSGELQAFEALRDNVHFRHSMTLMTLVWGFGLLADVAIAVALVLTLPVATYLLISPVFSYSVMGGLGLWTFWYAQRQRRRGAARQAAQEAARDAEPSPRPVALQGSAPRGGPCRKGACTGAP